MPNQGHKGKNLFDDIKNFFDQEGINIEDCRGQSYDNAPNMSAKYVGLKTLICKENPLATRIPCLAHSLNLVGNAAMNSCLESKHFFDFLQNLYTFFTASPERYEKICDKLEESLVNQQDRILVPKRVESPRWSAKADATKSLLKGYHQYKNYLHDLSEYDNEAVGLYRKISKLETGIYAIFWNDILQMVNRTSLKLQSPETDLNSSLELLKSLKSFIEMKRDDFEYYEEQGKLLSGSEEYYVQQHRIRRRNVRLNSPREQGEEEIEFTSSQQFRVNNFV